MHQHGHEVPWLDEGVQLSPTGDRVSNIEMEPAITFKIESINGKSVISDAEFFLVSTNLNHFQ